jgi:hypothetical protein
MRAKGKLVGSLSGISQSPVTHEPLSSQVHQAHQSNRNTKHATGECRQAFKAGFTFTVQQEIALEHPQSLEFFRERLCLQDFRVVVYQDPVEFTGIRSTSRRAGIAIIRSLSGRANERTRKVASGIRKGSTTILGLESISKAFHRVKVVHKPIALLRHGQK